ncbi:ATPase [Maritimibacter sp. 55A14]|uniref:ATPase n=1 Tax=Maritimibacter sp. 55A14 TaxID=2174844 RepID=UPI000D6162D9|nr:ATPase [Maritimibacter sp. 55A14]PWE33099.1 ATPase [Maritimibacter sp. 55A14]
MFYETAEDWRDCSAKRVLFFGMSGLGKTYVSNMLRDAGGWFHYSIDYRIGTRYMGEHIADNFKREAMRVPLLRDLLLSDSVYIASNITFNNLAPLSTYLGKPGNPEKGGIRFADYTRRQDQHRRAEIAALLDTPHFIARAQELYGYGNFVCDSSGSICEVVDPDDPEDEVLRCLSDHLLLVWIRGSEAHAEELIRRFRRAPKPMYYDPAFLHAKWEEYCRTNKVTEDEVDPDDFVTWTYSQALAHRAPRYAAMARNWGVAVDAEAIAKVGTPADLEALIANALEARGAPG